MGHFGAAKPLDKPVVKKCEYCGDDFECFTVIQKSTKKYCCDGCRKEANKKQARETRARLSAKRKEEKKKEQKELDEFDILMERLTKSYGKRHSSEEDLTRDAVAARQAGMSYGQYTSQKYAPRVGRN